jgi:hypothetical protein
MADENMEEEAGLQQLFAVPANVPAPAIEREDPDMALAMSWIGYPAGDTASPEALAIELGKFRNLAGFSHQDINTIFVNKDGVKNARGVKLKFPLIIQKNLRGLLDYAHDCARINSVVSLAAAGIDTPEKFREEIYAAAERKEIRKKEKDAHAAQLKIASPGKLKDEKSWADWLTGLQTTLSLIRGAKDVPLSYVIREHVVPPAGESYATFDEECIAKAPLEGTIFNADASTVHLIIKPLVLGENAEQWIKPGFQRKNGRDDLAKLMAHFQGEGNTSRRIQIAEGFWESLHYKHEKSMKFSDFISKAKSMLNIFEENKEAKPPAAQVRWLLDKIMNPTLFPTVESLKVNVEMDPNVWTFSKCANHIASNLRTVSPGLARSVSAVATEGGGNGRQGAYKNGKIHSGSYSPQEWNALSSDDKTLVWNARNKAKGSGGKGPGQKPASNNQRVKALTKKIQNQKKQISALQKRAPPSDDSNSGESDKDEPMNDAGNAFGGRAGKIKKKQKTG